jgi:hypothetical protein
VLKVLLRSAADALVRPLSRWSLGDNQEVVLFRVSLHFLESHLIIRE